MNLNITITSALLCIAVITSCNVSPEQRPAKDDFSRKLAPPKHSSRKLCIFMDGTLNTHKSQTNVRRMYELISAKRSPQTLCFYDVGVGSGENPITGTGLGSGFSQNVVEAYSFICENYRGPQDKIYIFGFSRGARQAQVLCDMLDECGIPPMGQRQRFAVNKSSMRSQSRDFYKKYKNHISQRRKGNAKYITPMHKRLQWQQPSIELIGIFDCVESVASNIWRGLKSGALRNGVYRPHPYYAYDLPENVKEAYHAMAMDEKRGLYQVIKWTTPQKKPKHQIMQQVWFAGGHGDVGGGYDRSQSLAGIPLNWMLSKIDSHGLIPKGYRVHADLRGHISDTRGFSVSKILSHFREDRPRHESFWASMIDPIGLRQGSLEFSKTDWTIRPLVHESVIRRLKMTKLQDSGNTLEADGYLPWLLESPTLEASYNGNKKPAFSYYLIEPGSKHKVIELNKFRKDIKEVHTDRVRSKAGGF